MCETIRVPPGQSLSLSKDKDKEALFNVAYNVTSDQYWARECDGQH